MTKKRSSMNCANCKYLKFLSVEKGLYTVTVCGREKFPIPQSTREKYLQLHEPLDSCCTKWEEETDVRV